MELWIARDENRILCGYHEKPIRDEENRCFEQSIKDEDCWILSMDDYPNVTWENSPQRVRIEIMEE